MKKLILFTSIVIILGSCSSRKIEKKEEHVKQSIVEQVKDTSSQKIESNTKIIDTSMTEEITYEPIVDSLPFTVNSKQFKNVKITTRKVKKGISSTKTENRSIQSSKIANKAITTQIDSSEKKVDRESSIFSWLWFCILVFSFCLVYYDYNKR